MNKRIGDLRVSVRTLHRKRPGRRHRYPAELRAEVVAAARALDQPISRTARELGLSVFTLHDWLRREDPAMKPVVVAADLSASLAVSLVTPTGFRIEGLDEAAAIRLLRALS